MQIVIGILTTLVVLAGLILIVLVMLQNPKNEGFGGVANAGGSGFRGKAGNDEILSNYTRIIAIGWFAMTFLLAVLNR